MCKARALLAMVTGGPLDICGRNIVRNTISGYSVWYCSAIGVSAIMYTKNKRRSGPEMRCASSRREHITKIADIIASVSFFFLFFFWLSFVWWLLQTLDITFCLAKSELNGYLFTTQTPKFRVTAPRRTVRCLLTILMLIQLDAWHTRSYQQITPNYKEHKVHNKLGQ
jgi:hypothetical protein